MARMSGAIRAESRNKYSRNGLVQQSSQKYHSLQQEIVFYSRVFMITLIVQQRFPEGEQVIFRRCRSCACPYTPVLAMGGNPVYHRIFGAS